MHRVTLLCSPARACGSMYRPAIDLGRLSAPGRPGRRGASTMRKYRKTASQQ